MLRHWIAYLLLVAGCLYIYQGILGAGFVKFDDDVNFVYNEKLGPLSWERLGWIATEHSVMLRYAPVGWLLCCGLTNINGLDPFWFHAASLALHAGSCVLLYELLRRLAPKLGIHPTNTPLGRLSGLLPVLLAAWWGWHPLRVETVAWATPLFQLLGTFFGLLSLLVLVRSAEEEAAGRAQGWARLRALALQMAALLSHPAALSFLPLYLLVWVLVLPPQGGLRNGLKDRAWQKATLRRVAPFFIAGVALLVLTLIMRQEPTLVPIKGTPGSAQFGVLERLAQASAVMMHFLEKTLWPGKLNPLYPLLYQVNPRAPVFILSMIAVCGLTGVFIFTLWRRLKAGLLGFATLAACIPVLGLDEAPYVPCDRFTHIPSLVLVIFILSVAGQNLVSKRLCVRVGIPLLAALLPIWAIVAERQTRIWSSTSRLFEEIASVQPTGEERSRYLGQTILEKMDEGKTEQARILLTQLHTREPMDTNIRALGTRLANIEQKKEAANYARLLNTQARAALKTNERGLAIERLRRALAFSPDYEEVRFNLGILLAMSGETQDSLAQLFWLQHRGQSLPKESLRTLRATIAGALRAKGQEELAGKLEAIK